MEAIVSNEYLKNEPGTDRYGNDKPLNYDQVINGQLMVQITLAEYRNLLTAQADAKVSDTNSRNYHLTVERDSLKAEVEKLKKQLDELRGMIASAIPAAKQGADE